YGLHMVTPTAILAGLIMAGTSPPVVFPVIARLSISKDLKTLLSLETVMTEILTVITVLLFLDIVHSPHVSGWEVITHLFRSISVAFVLAAVVGVAWSRVVPILIKEKLSY